MQNSFEKIHSRGAKLNLWRNLQRDLGETRLDFEKNPTSWKWERPWVLSLAEITTEWRQICFIKKYNFRKTALKDKGAWNEKIGDMKVHMFCNKWKIKYTLKTVYNWMLCKIQNYAVIKNRKYFRQIQRSDFRTKCDVLVTY